MKFSSYDIFSEDTTVENNTIKNLSIITEGEALGHGVWVDEEFLDKVVESGNNFKSGLKSRFGHPDFFSDAIGTELGRFTNFRKVKRYNKNRVIADMEFISTKLNEAQIDHITKFAETAPQDMGISIEFFSGEYKAGSKETKNFPVVTLKKLTAADFVHEPAANPNGLFTEKKQDENEENLFSKLTEFFDMKFKTFFSKKEDEVQKEIVEPTPIETPEAKPESKPIETQTDFTAEVEIDVDALTAEIEAKLIKKFGISEPINRMPSQKEELTSTVGNSNNLYANDYIDGVLAFRNQEYQNKIRREKRGTTRNRKVFATGADFSEAAARCVPFLNETFYEIIRTDDVFALMQPITARIPKGGTNLYDINIPRIDLSGAGTYEDGFIKHVGDGCIEFDPEGTFKPNQHKMTVRRLMMDMELCPEEWRDIADGQYYVDSETMPAEMILMSLIMNKMMNDYKQKFITGIYDQNNPYQYIDGVLTQVDDAILNPQNYSGRQPSTIAQVAYTNTNAVTQLEQFTDIANLPENLRYRDDLLIWMPRTIGSLYNRNFRASFTALPYQTGFFNMNVMDFYAQRFTFLSQLEASQRVMVTIPNNFVYAVQEADAWENPEIYVTPLTHKLQMRWSTYAGLSAKDFGAIVINQY